MTKRFSQLRKGKVNYLVPPNVQAMITACQYAQQDKTGAITLTYIDGTTETRMSDRDLCTEFDGFCSVVGYVQAQRAAA